MFLKHFVSPCLPHTHTHALILLHILIPSLYNSLLYFLFSPSFKITSDLIEMKVYLCLDQSTCYLTSFRPTALCWRAETFTKVL